VPPLDGFAAFFTVEILIGVNRHLSPRMKAHLIGRLCAGEISAIRVGNCSTGGIQLEMDAYRPFLIDARRRATVKLQTPTEAAAALHCDPGAVYGLFEMGFLTGKITAPEPRIKDESVLSFEAEYASLAPRAKALGRSTRGLMRRCRTADVQLLLVRVRYRKSPQPFARCRDLEILAAVFKGNAAA
jgi:hypothetical protein